ncbi:BamA/TamA family outer membrane protein [Candidatus Latescibacterota bacterium]
MIKKTAVVITLIMLIFPSALYAREKMSHTDKMNIRAENVEKINLRGIDFADLTYTGEDNRESFEVTITYTARVNEEEELEEIISEYDFEISESDNIVTMRLNNLRRRNRGFFNNLFKHNERRIILDVKGPSAIDIEIESDFSEILTNHTSGYLVFDTDFSSINSRDHNGRLNASLQFSSLSAEELIGSFNMNLEFGEADLEVAYLDDDSRASVEFGNIDIDLPADTGAEFRISKSLGGIDFDTSEPLEYDGNNDRRRILNDGEYIVDLSAEFGGITVRDNMKKSGRRSVRSGNAGQDEEDERKPKPKPKPVFEEGIVRSVKIRGTRLYDREDIEKKLDISSGKTYTRDEIAGEVKKLSEENRLISSTNYSIDIDGNLTVRIYEIEPYTHDFDLYGSFSRIGGLGIGPKLTINSEIGPLSEISGGGQYHLGNKEWTYNVHAEKHLFDVNRFTIGGTYRRDYESSMDWAIPPHDSHVNAFLLGMETKNYYQVEGATGYISQTLKDIAKVKAEYFEEDFSSVKKHTNVSIFNHSHKKEDNPMLNAASEGKITGMRYSLNLRKGSSFMNCDLNLEMEKTSDSNSGTLPAYTRYMGSIVHNGRLAFNHIIKMRIAGGYSEDVLPDQKSFRLGGVNTLRGYEFGMVPEPLLGTDGFDYQGGGSKMFLANFDYFTGSRGDDMRFVFFGDVGNVWQKGEKVDKKDLKRDLGVGLAFEGDFFRPRRIGSNVFKDAFRINWAVPVGNVSHVSMWTVNFVRAY